MSDERTGPLSVRPTDPPSRAVIVSSGAIDIYRIDYPDHLTRKLAHRMPVAGIAEVVVRPGQPITASDIRPLPRGAGPDVEEQPR